MKDGHFVRSFVPSRMRGKSQKKDRLKNEILPKFEITDANQVDLNGDIFFEIGSGSGETCTHLAKLNPNSSIIACEPFIGGVLQICNKIEELNLQNIHIFQNDGRDLLLRMKDECISNFYLLFPDPWPKEKHKKRRIFTNDFLKLVWQKLKKNGSLFVATDSDSYKEHIAEVVFNQDLFLWNAKSKNDFLREPEWWIKTKYQQKAQDEGRWPAFLHLIKI